MDVYVYVCDCDCDCEREFWEGEGRMKIDGCANVGAEEEDGN